MLKTIILERNSGKTTKAIAVLEATDNAILLVPQEQMKKIYPESLQNRVFTGKDFINGKIGVATSFNKVILDDGFQYDKETLATLYYKLGLHGFDVISYGTIQE